MDPIQAISGAADAALEAVRALMGETAVGGEVGQELGPELPAQQQVLSAVAEELPTAPTRPSSTEPLPPHDKAASLGSEAFVAPAHGTLAQLAAQGPNPHAVLAAHAPQTSDVATLIAQRATATQHGTPSPSAGIPMMAADSAPSRAPVPGVGAATNHPALAAHAIRPEAAAAFERAADAVLMAAQVNSLHTQTAQMQRTPAVPTRDDARARREEPHHTDWLEERRRAPQPDSSEPEQARSLDEPPAHDDTLDLDDPGYPELRQRLTDAHQHAALRELDQRRRVLLVVPAARAAAGRAPARAYLMCGAQATAHAFAARWWPGARGTGDWSAWRLHREGDGPRWHSRSTERERGAAPLLLRLAPPSHSLLEAAGACLDIGDARRFRHALGGQWSVLALLCPAWSPPAVDQQQRHDVS
jgi:hypothetical protein